MLGAPVGQQVRLFYEFCLEDLVPSDHLLRKVDAVLNLSWLWGALKAQYSEIERPSVCPELMIRMLLVGYCYSIRSERRLCQEVELNLAYRWFCRLGLEDQVPDHSTFSVNRHGRFRDSDILRKAGIGGTVKNMSGTKISSVRKPKLETGWLGCYARFCGGRCPHISPASASRISG